MSIALVEKKGEVTFDLGKKINETIMEMFLRKTAEECLFTTNIKSSDFTKEMNGVVEVVRKELCDKLSQQDYELMQKYEKALTEADFGDAEDHYIQGFLDGYRYFAERNTAKKNKNHVAGNEMVLG